MVKEIRSKILTIIKNKNKPISKDFKEQYNYYRKNHITSPKRKKRQDSSTTESWYSSQQMQKQENQPPLKKEKDAPSPAAERRAKLPYVQTTTPTTPGRNVHKKARRGNPGLNVHTQQEQQQQPQQQGKGLQYMYTPQVRCLSSRQCEWFTAVCLVGGCTMITQCSRALYPRATPSAPSGRARVDPTGPMTSSKQLSHGKNTGDMFVSLGDY